MSDQNENQAPAEQTGTAKSEPTARSMRTVAMTALGGTSIEWYDFLFTARRPAGFPTLFFAEICRVM